MTDFELPGGEAAEVHVLHEGQAGLGGNGERVDGPGCGSPFRPGKRDKAQA